MNRPTAPVLGVGAVVRRDDSVLLVKRGKPPSQGEWAIPGGRVHLGESLAHAAEREVLEETGILIEASEVIYTFEYIEEQAGQVAYHYVVLDLAARYLGGELHAGDDADEARWVGLGEVGSLRLNDTTHRALARLFPESCHE